MLQQYPKKVGISENGVLADSLPKASSTLLFDLLFNTIDFISISRIIFYELKDISSNRDNTKMKNDIRRLMPVYLMFKYDNLSNQEFNDLQEQSFSNPTLFVELLTELNELEQNAL